MNEIEHHARHINGMTYGAMLSPCGGYRYALDRQWRGDARSARLVFVMLNPSTADHTTDDPTIRRCMAFARREGYGALRVVNLFAFRTASPAALKEADDPVGEDNEALLIECMADAKAHGGAVVAAWGVQGGFLQRDRRFMEVARYYETPLHALGVTRDGHPRHPLYVKGDAPLTLWRKAA